MISSKWGNTLSDVTNQCFLVSLVERLYMNFSWLQNFPTRWRYSWFCFYLPKVPFDLHWHLPWVQKLPHMQRRPSQHCAYFILASGRQKSPQRAHQPLFLFIVENRSKALLSSWLSTVSSSSWFQGCPCANAAKPTTRRKLIRTQDSILTTVTQLRPKWTTKLQNKCSRVFVSYYSQG